MKDKRKFKKSLAEKHIEVEDMEEILEQYAVVERQVEKALVGNLDEAVAVEILEEFVEDVRIVQGVLLTKIVQAAITIGTPEEKFIEKVRLTWKYFERLDKERKEKEREGVIH
jgi:hypothetical protein